jgi:hypothetical protein
MEPRTCRVEIESGAATGSTGVKSLTQLLQEIAMPTNRIWVTALLAVVLVVQPATAQNKAAISKSVTEFNKLSVGFSASLSEISKRSATASPNDKDMLKLVISQLSIANATVEGVLDLGEVAAEVRDAGDLVIVKKHLAARCNTLKSMAESTGKYVDSVASNIAAVATAAEVTKSRELLLQMGQHSLCSPKPGKA